MHHIIASLLGARARSPLRRPEGASFETSFCVLGGHHHHHHPTPPHTTTHRHTPPHTTTHRHAPPHTATLQTSALGSSRVDALLRRGAARSAAALVGFHDLLALAPEAVAALEERERAHSALCVLETEARDRLGALQRARDAEAAAHHSATAVATTMATATSKEQPATREARRAASAREAYEAAERQAAAQRSAYGEPARRNASELARLSSLRSSGQRAALVGLARSQRAVAAALGELWEGIEAQLELGEAA